MPKLVLSQGPKDCKIAFIGQAPGRMELIEGQPFVGPAGKELNLWLQSAGINRRECYVTNVIKEYVSDIKDWIKIDGDKVKTTPGWDKYEEQLFQELSEVKANVIVPLGNEALYACTRLTRISKRRGSILSAHSGLAERKALPTIHPAAILRDPSGKRFDRWSCVADIHRASGESLHADIRLRERTYHLGPGLEEVLFYIELCRAGGGGLIGVDIEVIKREKWCVSCIALAISETDAICIPFVQNLIRPYWGEASELLIWAKIKQLLEDKSVIKVLQNASFDKEFLLKEYDIIIDPIEDSMVAAGILEPDFPKGLDFLTSIYTDMPYYKDEGKKNFKATSDDKSFWRYNAKDAVACLEVFNNEYKILEKRYQVTVYQQQRDLIDSLIYMQRRGFLIDVPGMEAKCEELKDTYYGLQTQLNELVGHPTNINSPKQMLELFYSELGFAALHTSHGKVTTDDTALRRLILKGCMPAVLVLEMRGIYTAFSRYFSGGWDPVDSRLRTSFNPVGAVTLRLSSSESIFGGGQNMQNLPPSYKKFMKADPDSILYEIDLSQAENRIVAYCGPIPELIEAFEQNQDVHALTASKIFYCKPEEVSDEKGSWIGGKSQRDAGKICNHGLDGGMGPVKLSLQHNIPLKDAREFISIYHKSYPNLRGGYHKWIEEQLRVDRTIQNLLGHRRTFRAARIDHETLQEAYDYFKQSSVACIINWRGMNYIYKHEPLVDLLLQVHDSIVFQIKRDVPISEHSRILSRIKHRLDRPLEFKNPITGHEAIFNIPVEVKVGTIYGTLKEVPHIADLEMGLKQLGVRANETQAT